MLFVLQLMKFWLFLYLLILHIFIFWISLFSLAKYFYL
jgi:hypothetical protein